MYKIKCHILLAQVHQFKSKFINQIISVQFILYNLTYSNESTHNVTIHASYIDYYIFIIYSEN